MTRLAEANGSAVSKTKRRTLIYKRKATVPANTGETTQLAAIFPTFIQLTASTEMPTDPKPTIAPTMLCVVDTGQPYVVAIKSQIPAARSADIIP